MFSEILMSIPKIPKFHSTQKKQDNPWEVHLRTRNEEPKNNGSSGAFVAVVYVGIVVTAFAWGVFIGRKIGHIESSIQATKEGRL
jgi:hypothetical protein